jgi:hypothetical protein
MKFDAIRELIQLLNNIDFDEADIDINQSSSAREARRRSSARNHRQSEDTEGREKFARKRRIKRLNRLIKRAERNGEDIGDYIPDEEPSIHVSKPHSNTVKIVIDRHPVDVEFDETTPHVELLYNGSSTTVELPAVPVELREKTEQNSITTLRFRVVSDE